MHETINRGSAAAESVAFRPRLSLTMTERIIGAAPLLYEGSFADGIRQAKRLGYDCGEIHLANPENLDLPALLQALDETGLTVSALGTGQAYVNEGLSLIDDDDVVRDEAVRRLMGFVDAAERLGCVVIVGCIRGNVPDMGRYAHYARRLAESLGWVDAHAGAKGVTLALEGINRYENNFLCSAAQIVSFIQEQRLNNTKLMLDTFHMNIEERDMAAAIEENGAHLAYVHIADSNRRAPGEGHIDYFALMRALRRIGYSGAFGAECLPLPSKEAAAKNWLSYVKGVLAGI